MGEIRDGTSNTYLIGEKHMDSNLYEGVETGDNETLYSGSCNDVLRGGYYNTTADNAGPVADRPGYAKFVFGSSHAGTFGMVMADGSVQRVSYSIDPKNHYYLAHRADNQVTTLEQ